MTLQIALVSLIVGGAVALFVVKQLRVDLVALLVLISLVLIGLRHSVVTLSSFSISVVVMVRAVFILSRGISRFGVGALLLPMVMDIARRLILLPSGIYKVPGV